MAEPDNRSIICFLELLRLKRLSPRFEFLTEKFDMLQAEEVLKVLVGLKEAGDLEIVGSESVLANICKFNDRPKVLAMASIVRRLLDEFDYELSPEFLEKIDGKSEHLQAMQRKLLTRERRKQLAERFGRSLTQIVDSRDAYAFVPSVRHIKLDELRSIAKSIQC